MTRQDGITWDGKERRLIVGNIDRGTEAIIKEISREILDESSERWEKVHKESIIELRSQCDKSHKVMQDYCDRSTIALKESLDIMVKQNDTKHKEHDKLHTEEKTERNRKWNRFMKLIFIPTGSVLGIGQVKQLICWFLHIKSGGG